MKQMLMIALAWALAVGELSAAVTYGKVYWSDNEAHCIRRANLDGTHVETVVANSGRPWGLAIDSENARLYWADNDPYALPVISRCNLDGSGIQVLISEAWNSGMQFPQFIALDGQGGKLYYTS